MHAMQAKQAERLHNHDHAPEERRVASVDPVGAAVVAVVWQEPAGARTHQYATDQGADAAEQVHDAAAGKVNEAQLVEPAGVAAAAAAAAAAGGGGAGPDHQPSDQPTNPPTDRPTDQTTGGGGRAGRQAAGRAENNEKSPRCARAEKERATERRRTDHKRHDATGGRTNPPPQVQ